MFNFAILQFYLEKSKHDLTVALAWLFFAVLCRPSGGKYLLCQKLKYLILWSKLMAMK
jgi:hypothetical protein